MEVIKLNVGEHVKVTQGEHTGKTGNIVNVLVKIKHTFDIEPASMGAKEKGCVCPDKKALSGSHWIQNDCPLHKFTMVDSDHIRLG